MHALTLTALLGIVVGVFCGESSLYGSEIASAAFVVALLQVLLVVVEKNKEKKKMNAQHSSSSFSEASSSKQYSFAIFSAVFFCFVTVGIVRVQFVQEKSNFVCAAVCTFGATVHSPPKIKNNYQVFSVRLDGNDDMYNIQVKTPLYPKYEVGERLLLTGKVSLPKTIMPHAMKKAFEYDMYLRVHDIGSEMYYPKVEREVATTQKKSFRETLMNIKESYIETIATYVSQPAASLSSGMLFGATSMSQELIQTFRVAGLSHIVVLSGFNIVILISFVLWILVFVPLVMRVILAVLFVIIFVIMVGGEASVIRATLMSCIGLVALLVGRAYAAKQALILSLIAIILFEPANYIYDVSLHLSFLAAAGIIYMSEGVQTMLRGITSQSYKEIITTTLCAYVATLPYVIYTFGTVSVYALLANSIVLPLVPIVMLLTFFVVVIAPFTQTLASLIGYVDSILGDIIIWTARSIERLPFSSVTISFSWVAMVSMYIILACGYYFLVRRFSVSQNNETSLTKDGVLYSEIISF